MEPGVYEIESKSIFAIQEYSTKEIKDCVLEGHAKYIDIQYIIQGVELMGVTTKKIKAITRNLDEDYTFYSGETSLIKVEEGMFTIFFPDDLHMPCVQAQSSKVKKVVVKVQI
jgi:YhcH/YjgK/YiaL family protein